MSSGVGQVRTLGTTYVPASAQNTHGVNLFRRQQSNACTRGAEEAWRDGYAYSKAGIMLDDLLPEDERPRTLFEEDTAKRYRPMGALDVINGKFGT